MKTGIYYKGKFIRLDLTQLDVNEKAYVLYEPFEFENPNQPDTFIAEKTREVQHESGGIIHYHLHKPAPQALRALLKAAVEEVEAPKGVKGLQKIIEKVKG